MIEISRLRGSAPNSVALPNNLPKLNAYKSRQTSSRGNRFYLEKCLLERNLKNSDNDSEFIHSV